LIGETVMVTSPNNTQKVVDSSKGADIQASIVVA